MASALLFFLFHGRWNRTRTDLLKHNDRRTIGKIPRKPGIESHEKSLDPTPNPIGVTLFTQNIHCRGELLRDLLYFLYGIYAYINLKALFGAFEVRGIWVKE